jgi:hypothetical protein
MTATLRLIVENEIRGDSRRQKDRSRVMLSAVMMTAAAKVDVVIRDISENGAMITTSVSPSVGSYVTLRRGAVCVVAQVMWREGRKVGLHFRDSIDASSLLVVIGRPGATSAH